MFLNGKRNVGGDVEGERIWIGIVGGVVWSCGGQVWDVVNGVVWSVVLENVAWK